jgi:hypothetical protein
MCAATKGVARSPVGGGAITVGRVHQVVREEPSTTTADAIGYRGAL